MGDGGFMQGYKISLTPTCRSGCLRSLDSVSGLFFGGQVLGRQG